jgi:hypothetical protein
LTGAVLLLLWGMVLIRLPTLRRDARQRALWATLCALALTKTAAIFQAQALRHLFGVVAAYFLLRFISLITDYDRAHPRAVRHQLLLAASVLAALITLRVTAPASGAYGVILNGYQGTVLAVATAVFWRIGRSAPAGPLRHGLRAIATGTFLVALSAVLKTTMIVLPVPGGTRPVADALHAFGVLIAVVGAAVPASGNIRAYRSLWALRPLWREMRRTFPEVILFPGRRALLELAGAEGVQLRLYRRVIEIRDGMLTLRHQLPAGTLAEAREHVGDSPALIEACGIARALHRHRSGEPPAEHSDRWASVGGQIADEVAWLSAVSAAFRSREAAAFAYRRREGVTR